MQAVVAKQLDFLRLLDIDPIVDIPTVKMYDEAKAAEYMRHQLSKDPEFFTRVIKFSSEKKNK